MLHILGGACRLTVRLNGDVIVRNLAAGDLAVVPKDCWHRNDAADGVTMLWITPREGNRHSWEAPGG
jgi:quercetin dioxygenase-like cupin family protein